MQRRSPTFRGTQFLLAFLLSFASRAFAIELLVSNTNNSGSGSLRQAVNDNNALGGSNTIVFSNIVTGTITLTNGELLITKDATILGPGAKVLAVNGNAASRVFHITNATVTISDLTITNGMAVGGFPGNSGGGIWNDHSTLTLSNCTITGNSATSFGGGIYNDGRLSGGATLTVVASTVHGNSVGGIFNDGDSSGHAILSVIVSTISSNSSPGGGGGIYNYGDSGNASTLVIASTLSGNSAPGGNGGGIWNDGFGGSATALVNGCTFSGNSASGIFGGGAIYQSAPAGGSATLEIGDTILRHSPFGGNIYNNSGVVISHGYNLASDNNFLLTQPTDQVNTDPVLGPLADSGGPTRTHALLPGSPAIDKGKRDAIPSLAMNTDQRGAPRPFDFVSLTNAVGGDGSDIGAFELGSPKLDIQQVGGDAVLSWPSPYGDFSLQSSTNVALSDSWITASGSRVVVGNLYQQTNSPISGNQFFRLRGN